MHLHSWCMYPLSILPSALSALLLLLLHQQEGPLLWAALVCNGGQPASLLKPSLYCIASGVGVGSSAGPYTHQGSRDWFAKLQNLRVLFFHFVSCRNFCHFCWGDINLFAISLKLKKKLEKLPHTDPFQLHDNWTVASFVVVFLIPCCVFNTSDVFWASVCKPITF